MDSRENTSDESVSTKEFKQEANKLKENLAADAADVKASLSNTAENEAKRHAETGKNALGRQADALSSALDGAAENLDAQNHPFAHYATELSEQLSGFSSKIESKSVNELASDVRRLARNNPTAFMLGSVATGLMLSRFLKAGVDTSEQTHQTQSMNHSMNGPGFRSENVPVQNSTVSSPVNTEQV